MKQKICLFLYIALLAVKILAQNIAVPELHARVTDLTSTLTAEQTQTLTNTIIQFEQQNPQNAQLAILILPTTGGNTSGRWRMLSSSALPGKSRRTSSQEKKMPKGKLSTTAREETFRLNSTACHSGSLKNISG